MCGSFSGFDPYLSNIHHWALAAGGHVLPGLSRVPWFLAWIVSLFSASLGQVCKLTL